MIRHLRSFAVLLVGLGVSVVTAFAQPVVVNIPPGTFPRTVPTTASVTISGAFAIVPVAPPLTQTTQQGNLCNPGACFTGTMSVQANSRWQVQVRVKPTAPTTFIVNWITPAPSENQVRFSTAWYTIKSGTTPSTSTAMPVKYNANKTTGKGGVVPTAAQLTSYLEYRIIALP